MRAEILESIPPLPPPDRIGQEAAEIILHQQLAHPDPFPGASSLGSDGTFVINLDNSLQRLYDSRNIARVVEENFNYIAKYQIDEQMIEDQRANIDEVLRKVFGV